MAVARKSALFLSCSLVALSMSIQTHAAEVAVAAADADALAGVADQMTVYGQGETRQVQELHLEDVQKLPPGTSPLKAIAKLPGVNFQSADPFGTYEWSARISIRGFNQNQLGFTLDGVPLGDMSYGNYNGLHISRAISSENISLVKVSQGSGDLGTASTSNLGGTLQFFSRDPAHEFGGDFSATYGSENTVHGFGRIDTGDLSTGTRAYISYGYQNADKWKGHGSQRQNQVNFKFVQPIGAAKLTGFVNYSDRRENDYQDMSQEMISRLGSNWDNYASNWALAVQVAQIANNRGDVSNNPALSFPGAGTTYPGNITSVDDAYYDAAGLRKDWLTGITLDTPLGDLATLKVTGYYHNNKGQGIWYSPYVATPGGAPISIRTTEYDINRKGVIASLTRDIGTHTLTAGLWYENNDFNEARRFYGLADAATPSRTSLDFQSDPFFTQWDFKYKTRTLQVHVEDSWAITPEFTLTAGFKGMKVTNEATPIVNVGGKAAGHIKSQDWFIPQAGLLYKLNDDSQLFAQYSQNMRALVSALTAGPFSTTQAGFDAISNHLKPETSDTYEAGWRFKSRSLGVQGVLAAYYVNFKNRLLSVSSGAGIIGSPSVLQNVGGVKSKGIEAALTWQIADYVSLFGSYAYNDSTYSNDVVDGNGNVTFLDGKTVVDTPKHMMTGEISYDDQALFAKFGVTYMSKRYFTYTNDQWVGGRAIAEATLGYRFSGSKWMNGFEVQGNVTNLFDTRYVSTVGSAGFGNSGDRQTLLPGAPRQFFVTLRKAL